MGKKTNIVILFLMVLSLLCLAACGKSKETKQRVYKYNLKENDDVFSNFYIEKTEYYKDKVIIYCGGPLSESLDKSHIFEQDGVEFSIDKNKIIAKSDTPEIVNQIQLTFENGDLYIYVRYLDSDMYAALQLQYDSEGGVTVVGNKDAFYTEEEKENIASQEKERQEKQAALFERLEGRWVSTDGKYFVFSKDGDTYTMEHYCDDGYASEDYRLEKPIWFEETYNEDEIAISYPSGPLTSMQSVIMIDENTFKCGNLVYEKQ